MPRHDLTGMKYGRFTVMSYVGKSGIHQIWKCKCECGTVKDMRANTLRTGLAKSCGCWKKDVTAKRAFKHGFSNRREYFAYNHAKQRCTNPNTEHYACYGGRGISMCKRWLGENGFQKFLNDMGACPDNHTLERKDVNKGYSPGNCIWLAAPLQSRNKRNTVMLTIGEETKSLYEWADIATVSAATIKGRLQRGWTHERAVYTPLVKPWSELRRMYHVG